MGIDCCGNFGGRWGHLHHLFSRLAVLSNVGLEISLFWPEDLASLPLFRDVVPDCGWNPDRWILFQSFERVLNIQERRVNLLPLLWAGDQTWHNSRGSG